MRGARVKHNGLGHEATARREATFLRAFTVHGRYCEEEHACMQTFVQRSSEDYPLVLDCCLAGLAQKFIPNRARTQQKDQREPQLSIRSSPLLHRPWSSKRTAASRQVGRHACFTGACSQEPARLRAHCSLWISTGLHERLGQLDGKPRWSCSLSASRRWATHSWTAAGSRSSPQPSDSWSSSSLSPSLSVSSLPPAFHLEPCFFLG